MNIVRDFPPNYAQIVSCIPAVKKMPGLIFTYGDTLYISSGNPIPDHLMAHEETHARQQTAMGPAVWWDRYLADREFRLEQELAAYQAQYAVLLTKHNRRYRRQILPAICSDLAGPAYGSIISEAEAKQLISG